jgi:DNA-binding MarR family transcriptional regulator
MTTSALLDVLPVLVRLGRILETAPAPVSLSQYRLMALVASGEAQASRLATKLAVSRPTITATVDSLLSSKLLTRRKDSQDGRVATLALTASGRRKLQEANQLFEDRLGVVFNSVSDPDALVRLLLEVDAGIEEQHARRRRNGV